MATFEGTAPALESFDVVTPVSLEIFYPGANEVHTKPAPTSVKNLPVHSVSLTTNPRAFILPDTVSW